MQLSGARVLVAGGSGFIGTNLIARLLSEGCWVRATLHTRRAVIEDPAIEYLTADLTSMEDCRRVVDGVDYVFMCAASTSGAVPFWSATGDAETSTILSGTKDMMMRRASGR